MTLYEAWIKSAYDSSGQSNKKFWSMYTPLEKQIYEDLLEDGSGSLNMPLVEFAKKYHLRPEYAVGFLDGIGESLEEKVDVESVTEEFVIDIKVNYEKLFNKMVEYKAKHLYTLPQWEKYFDTETQERMINDQRRSRIFVAGEKQGRNDACNCGSGKKYKKCCGISDSGGITEE